MALSTMAFRWALVAIFLFASTATPCTAQVPISSGLPRLGKCPNFGIGPAVICQKYDVTCQISCPANRVGVIRGQTIIAHLQGGVLTNTCASGDVLIALASVLCNTGTQFAKQCGGVCYATVEPVGAAQPVAPAQPLLGPSLVAGASPAAGPVPA